MPRNKDTVFNFNDAGLIEVLQARQETILGLMPKYFKRVLGWAMFGFVVSIFLQSTAKVAQIFAAGSPQLWVQRLVTYIATAFAGTFAVDSVSLGSIISIVLSLFSNVIMWAFVFWSLTFIPYIAFNSYKVSQQVKSNIATKPFKWVQLYASTFLPMAAFAIAWNSVPTHNNNVVIEIKSLDEALVLIAGTVGVAVFLFLINWLVPSKIISVRLSLFSALFYASLFLAYGQGYSVASFSTLFGILFYLMFASSQIEEMGRRIVVYDLDASVAKKLDVINMQLEDLQVAKDETLLSQKESLVLQEQIKTKNKLAESQAEQDLSQQLQNIQKEKVDLLKMTNQAHIEMLEQRINMLREMFTVVSNEFSGKLKQEFPKRLDEIKREAQTLPPQELYSRLNGMMKEMNPMLEGLPQTLGDLRTQLLKATNEMEEQTRSLLMDSSEEKKN